MNHWTMRVACSTAFSVAAEVLARAANTIFFVLLARYVSEIEAGRYTIGFTFSLLLLPFVFGGFDQLLIRESARNQNEAPLLLGNLLLARVAGAMCCYGALLAWLVWGQGQNGYDARTMMVVALLAATCIPDSLTNLYQGYLFAFNRVSYTTLVGAITGVFKLGAGLAALALGTGAEGAALTVLLASVLSLLLHAYFVRRAIGPPVLRIAPELWRRYTRPSLAFYAITVFAALEGSFDALLLSRTDGLVAAGLYGAATTIISILNIIPQGIRQSLLPEITRAYAQTAQQAAAVVGQALRLILIGTLLIAVTLTILSDLLLPFIFRDSYAAAGPVLVTLVWAFVLACCAIPNARLIIAAGRQHVFVPLHALSLLLNVGLNLLLQPMYGVQGAAYARLVSAALVCLFGIGYVQWRIVRWPIGSVIGRPLLAASAALLLAGGAAIVHIPVLLVVPLAWLGYVGVLWLLRVFNGEDVRRLRLALRRRATPDLS